MTKSSICIVIVCFIIVGIVNPIIGQYTFNSSGKSINTPAYLLTFSIGEITNQDHQGNDYSLKNGVIQYRTENTSSLSELSNVNLRIYPNPAHDYITFETESSTLTRYQIFDLKNKLIKEGDLSNNYLSINDLAPAGYLIKFSSQNHSITKLFIKL